jgi:hypothetical protein
VEGLIQISHEQPFLGDWLLLFFPSALGSLLISERVLARDGTEVGSLYRAICSFLGGHIASLARIPLLLTSSENTCAIDFFHHIFRLHNLCACRTIGWVAAGVRCPRLACCSSSRGLSGWLGSYLDDMHWGVGLYPANLSSNFFAFSPSYQVSSHCRLYISPVLLPRNIVSL